MAQTTSGISRYTVVEASNVTLGQLGFDVLAASQEYFTTTAGYSGPWIGIKSVNATNNLVSATTSIGDDLGAIAIVAGDILYGAFTDIQTGTFGVDGFILAYRG